MTKQEFDNMLERAKLNAISDYNELFEMVDNAINALSVLDEYDGEQYEN